MKNSETLTLIDGIFTPDDAKEMLSNLISSNIGFHNIKNWRSQEQFGREDYDAQKRIPELKKELEKLQTLTEEAKGKKLRIAVRSEIYIYPFED